MPKIKIVFCDVDNTLITSKNKLLPQVSSAIQDYVVAGGIFVLTSARPPMGMQALAQQIGCSSLQICLNGALILQKSQNSVETAILFEKSIPTAILPTILQIVSQQNLTVSVNVFAGKKWLVQQHDCWVKQEEEITGASATITSFDSRLRNVNHPIHKILCMGEPDQIDNLETLLDRRSDLYLSYLRSKPTYLEIVDHSVSKMRAIETVANFAHIPIEQTMAIGDGENDLPMIKDAGIGIAVANSFPKVKAAATHIVSSNDNGGVAEAIRKYTGLSR